MAISSIRRPRRSGFRQRSSSTDRNQRNSLSLADISFHKWKGSNSSVGTADTSMSRSTSRLSMSSSNDDVLSKNGSVNELNVGTASFRKASGDAVGPFIPTMSPINSDIYSVSQTKTSDKLSFIQKGKNKLH